MSERMARAAGLRVCSEAAMRASEAVGCTFGMRGWGHASAMWHVHSADGEFVMAEYLFDRPHDFEGGIERMHADSLVGLERVA